MPAQKAKFSVPMILLGVITLILSAYGLFDLAHTYAEMPMLFAVVAVAGFDLAAIALGWHAMALARDGDSAGPWNAGVIGIAILTAALQYAHSQLSNQPPAAGIMMATFPLATVALFEGTLRRAHRLNGRRTGRVAPPRATFELVQWFWYPRAVLKAFGAAVADRSLGADDAFKLGLMMTAKPAEQWEAPERESQIQFNWAAIVPGHPAIFKGKGVHPEIESGSSGSESGPSGPDRPDTRSLKTLATEFLQVSGADDASVTAAIKAVRPDVKDDSIRKAITAVRTLRSA